MNTWILKCTACETTLPGEQRVNLCPKCDQPMWAQPTGPLPGRAALRTDRWDMWRYSALLPAPDKETPVSLGEGCTPLTELPAIARDLGVKRFWIKDEGVNPTASFKARGLSAAVTRARTAPGVVVPTAGNAGAALAAYGAAAGIRTQRLSTAQPAANAPAKMSACRRTTVRWRTGSFRWSPFRASCGTAAESRCRRSPIDRT